MKVLLASDGSDAAVVVADFLAKLGWHDQVDVIVLTVSHDPGKLSSSYVSVSEDWKEQESHRVVTHHEQLLEGLRDRVRSATSLHRFGDTEQTILSVATETGADVIAMGAQGHSMIRRVLLGSVSDYVANHADCSVLIVRPLDQQVEPLGNVLMAYDGSAGARRAAEGLSSMPWGDVTPHVTLLSVVQAYEMLIGDGPAAAAMAGEQEWFDSMKENNRLMAEVMTESIAGVDPQVIRAYHVGDAIVDHADKHPTQLIVVADGGHNQMEDWLLGSTSRYVMRHAHCSVWISRSSQSIEGAAVDSSSQEASPA